MKSTNRIIHNPLARAMLAVVAMVGAARAGIQPGLLRADELRIDGMWKPPASYPRFTNTGNGSRRVKRVALKRRNVRRNHLAHRG